MDLEERVDHQDNLVLPEQPAQLEVKVCQAYLARKVKEETLAHKDRGARQDLLAPVDRQDLQGLEVPLVRQVLVERMDVQA